MESWEPDRQLTVEMSENALKGKGIFTAKCASCHSLFKNDGDMMQIKGFTYRYPLTNRQNVYDWFRYPDSFAAKKEYKRKIREVFSGNRLPAFPELTDTEIDAIIDYTDYAAQAEY